MMCVERPRRKQRRIATPSERGREQSRDGASTGEPCRSKIVAAIETELRAESPPTDTFSGLEPGSVRLGKTASRSTLGFMNEMAFELRYLIADAGGLGRCDIVLNHGLRRTLRNRGEYVRPIELVARRLTSRT